MRKFFYLIALLIVSHALFSQPLKFKAGLIPGPTATTVDIVIIPNVNFTGYPTNVIFVFQIPQNITQPVIAKIPLSPYFVAFNDLPTLPNVNGWTTYAFSAVNAANITNVNIIAGAIYPILRLSFASGPSAGSIVRLAHLANGGPGTLYQNYIEANAIAPPEGSSDFTNYVQMFSGGTVEPAAPYANEGLGYSNDQWVTIFQVLPLKWLSFNAIKRNNDALINWSVSDEDMNHHYELLRSLNGVDFSPIATINKTGTGNVIHDYTYTDNGITNLGSSIIYYRLKQVDMDGKSSYSEIRKINIGLRSDIITVYPNPVKDGFYVVMPGLQQSTAKNIKLVLISSSGQLIQTKEISSLQAVNYYFDVKGLQLAGGNYFLQIIKDGFVLDKKQLFISKD